MHLYINYVHIVLSEHYTTHKCVFCLKKKAKKLVLDISREVPIYPPCTLMEGLPPPTVGHAYPTLETTPQSPEQDLQLLWSLAQLDSGNSQLWAAISHNAKWETLKSLPHLGGKVTVPPKPTDTFHMGGRHRHSMSPCDEEKCAGEGRTRPGLLPGRV